MLKLLTTEVSLLVNRIITAPKWWMGTLELAGLLEHSTVHLGDEEHFMHHVSYLKTLEIMAATVKDSPIRYTKLR